MPKLIFKRVLLAIALMLAVAAGAAAQEDPYAPAPPAPPTPKPLVVPQLMTVNPPAAGAYDSVLPTPTPTPVVLHQGVFVATLGTVCIAAVSPCAVRSSNHARVAAAGRRVESSVS